MKKLAMILGLCLAFSAPAIADDTHGTAPAAHDDHHAPSAEAPVKKEGKHGKGRKGGGKHRKMGAKKAKEAPAEAAPAHE